MPDLKYHSDELAASCSSAPRYFRFASQALLEMRRLAGPPRLKHGILEQGVLVRHLVLPGHADDSQKVLDWLHDAFEDSVLVSLMAQYYPVHRASELPGLNRRLSTAEYSQVRDRFVSLGLEGFAQELSSAAADYTPDFKGDGL
jgi:putative pyruvate formate lyase activating enzyme